ncbi:DUF542 domain-containing protein [Salinicoccus albus]|uniref:DUF542 domain-containing protein n=1 Tax=Salinicoccus albus TaxID=418756 RepID=UPI0003614CAE|nr:DUF542 domain-containing protein [Salinicoccus albus]
MKTITGQMTVGEIAVEVPKSGDIFRAYHIDFVNRGNQSLSDAAFEHDVPIENILYEINNLGTENEDGIDIKYMDETSIVRYIQRRYHEDLKDELPVLEPYVEKMVKEKPEEAELSEVFLNFSDTVLDHTDEEDLNVFPLLESYLDQPSEDKRGALKPKLKKLKNEHKDITEFFVRMREITNDFIPAEGDSGALRLVYMRLEKLEKDSFDHIHLENNILFERIRNKVRA